MKCELIFYLAGRTGQLEDLLAERLSELGVSIAEVTAATSQEELAAALEKGVSRRNLLLVVGGMSKPNEENAARQISKLLSLPLSSVNPPVFRNGTPLFAGENRQPGFFLESGRQSLLLLPDDPETVGEILDRRGLSLVREKYALLPQHRQTPDPEQRGRELQAEIKSSQEAAGVAAKEQAAAPFGSASEGKHSEKKKKIGRKVLLALLGLAAIALAVLAVLLLAHQLPGLESWLRGQFPSLTW